MKAESLVLGQVFKQERFPNIVVALNGDVVASWGNSQVRVSRSTDGGMTWSDPIVVAKPGFQAGGLTVDEATGDILLFSERQHPPAELTMYRSQDHGQTWEAEVAKVQPDRQQREPSMHMNDHGITLRRGDHAGRLLRPSRYYAGKNERGRWPKHFTNAIFSDDHGKTWRTSEPFPAMGTGEAAIVQLSDGRLYYNSRRHWAPEGENPRRRWSAMSDDGGETWKDLKFVQVLPDGPQDTNYGCMGGLTRLPVAGRDILLYCNCDSPKGRVHGAVWCSFDGGQTWPLKREVYSGAFAYSAMYSGRPGTVTEGWVYLHFEGGPKGGSTVARFNLAWILAGERTGDGAPPSWAQQTGKE